MATEQVFDWIKNELQLSKTVSSFEGDFSNGVLFAEIFNSYGNFCDLSQFTKKTNKEGKVNNFYMVEDALRACKIKFDGKLIHNIMNEERGAALRLLYQMKLALQKMDGGGPLDLEAMTQTGLKGSIVKRKLEQKFEHTMNTKGKVQPRTKGGKDLRTVKAKREDDAVIKYKVTMNKQFDHAMELQNNEKALIQTLQQNQRTSNIDKLNENRQFLKEWEAEGKQNWRTNQVRRQEAINKVQFFEDREVDIYKKKLSNALNAATSEMKNGVGEFEKNLQKLGIEQNINMDDAIKKQEEKKGIPPGQIQNFSYAATMNKIKESKKNTDFAGKERERRQRKLMVDQAQTQLSLDVQKSEDSMLERLLEQQTREQKLAYIDLHNRQCKEMVYDNKANRATSLAESRKTIAIQLEQKRVDEAKAGEQARQKGIDNERVTYRENRRTEKEKTRALNIEIASELADLILDCAEETYQLATQKQAKVSKGEWRQFMDIFKDGKKVSLRDLKKKPIEDKAGAQDELNEIKLNFKSNQRVQEVLKEFSNHPALEDFYQYLCSCGKFNLAQISQEHFKEFLNLLPEDNKNLDQALLSNSTLVTILEDIQVRAKAEKAKKAVFPTGISTISDHQLLDTVAEETIGVGMSVIGDELAPRFDIRMSILGRVFSGKKTISKKLQDQLGGQSNLKIFTLEDVIKEALAYTCPNKTDESIIDPKKKPPAKGAKEEEKPIDIYEGKDTEHYKELSNKIREQYFGGDEDQVQSASKDSLLVNRILDDNILVQIFASRLSLQFGDGKTQADLDKEIREGVIREQEISAQLKELEEKEGGAPADPKKAAAKGAPKGGGKTPEETMKDELDQIKQVAITGWVLLDFPKTLNQMKLLENALSGYVSKVDQLKDEQDELYEAQAKCVLSSAADGMEEVAVRAAESGLDGVLFLQTPADECIRRTQNRKTDPATGTIYHMDDNPPAEDPKLREKLVDYVDESRPEERINEEKESFETAQAALQTWTESFGQYAPEATECSVQTNMPISTENWNSVSAVDEAVMSQVQNVINFKQKLWDLQRATMLQKVLKDQEQERIEAERKAEEERQATADAEAKAAEESAKDPNATPPVETTAINEDSAVNSQKAILTERQHVTAERAQSDLGMLSSNQGETVLTRSQMKSSLQMQRVYEITDFEKAKRWPRTLATYYRNGMQNFHLLRLQRQTIFRNLNDTQKKYIDFLMRQSNQQETINEFCESYNRFSTEFPELRGNPSTRDELLNRVDILSHNLWQVIMSRKVESMQERERLMEGGWVSIEMNNLCNYVSNLVENEFLRFSAVVSMVTGYVINEDVDAVGLCNRLSERNTQHLHVDPATGACSSPLLDQVSSQVIIQVDSYLAEAQALVKLDDASLEILLIEQRNFNFRLNQLKTHALLLLNEVSIYSHQVFDQLDDWVVIAVESENDGVQEVVRQIRQAVKTNQSYIESFIIHDANLFNLIETINFQDGPPLYIQNVEQPTKMVDCRFTLPQLTMFYNFFRKNAAFDNILDAQTLLSAITSGIQSNQVPNRWNYMPFAAFNNLINKFKREPLSDESSGAEVNLFSAANREGDKRVFVDWKMVMTVFALFMSALPTTAQMNEYVQNLKAAGNSTLVSLDNFLQVKAWFDITEGAQDTTEEAKHTNQLDESDEEEEDESNLDQGRIRQIKTLLYNTLRQTNQAGIKVSTLESVLASLSALAQDKSNGDRTLTFGEAVFA